MKLKNALIGASLLATAALSSCGGGGVTYGYYNTPYISATQFVNALNDVDNAPYYDESEIILYTDETIRSAQPGQDDWFVIWDAEFNQYKAVSLQYIRAITYYSYYSSSFQTAEEFREIEADDRFYGYFDGDLFGNDYEVVDLVGGIFYGRESGYAYEDEMETTDVNLLAGEQQVKKLAQKVSNISYAYQVSPEMALSLVSLGEKVENMLQKGAGQQELTDADQEVLLKDLEHLTGVTLEEVIAAGNDANGKKEILNKIAAKNADSGITSQKLEDKILPELFGIK
jgi:hypothetical protein